MIFNPEGALSFVRPDTVEEKTKGGIILPPVAKEKEERETTTGVIIAIGPAASIEFIDGPAKNGDHVLFAKYAGFVVRDDDTGIDYRIVDHKDFLSKIE